MTSLEIPLQEVQRRLSLDNPWWRGEAAIEGLERSWPHRSFFTAFSEIAQNRGLRRAVVLIGPRRVGKTVMLRQFIQSLLDMGTKGLNILFLSLDTPLYGGRSLENLLNLYMDIHGHKQGSPLWVLFDEIQYLKDWGIHLKSLVDAYPAIRFIASGSAAAALKMKSRESGAGRFTDFILPPLSFAEFLSFTGKEKALIGKTPEEGEGLEGLRAADITALNAEFVDYLNYGGFPEAVLTPSIRDDPTRFLRQDIVDKVLLKDLPSLYGISDTQALNQFFNVLAFNTGNEVGLEMLSSHSDLGKQRLSDFLEYLEAAYMIRRIKRVDINARRLQRERTFKVYITNPSIRAALFDSVTADSEAMGKLAETALFCQWIHDPEMSASLHYARWKAGRADREVDMVSLDAGTQLPRAMVEVKWSDRVVDRPEELVALLDFAGNYPMAKPVIVTTRTWQGVKMIQGRRVYFIPSALYCYAIGKGWA